MENNLDPLWQKLRAGHHIAVLGTPMMRFPPDLRPIRVRCVAGGLPWAPLLNLQEQLLPDAPLLDLAAGRVRAGLKRRIFGDEPQTDRGTLLVERLNDAASARPLVLVIEDVQAADSATLQWLERVERQPEWLQVPLLLGFNEKTGPAEQLLERMQAKGHVFELSEEQPTPAVQFPRLSPQALKVLRVAALSGPRFEAELIAEVLESPVAEVLLALQEAVDAGLSLQDDGEGLLEISEAHSQYLRKGILPSLAAFWHRRIAKQLSSEVELVQEEKVVNTEATPTSEPPSEDVASEPQAAELPPEPVPVVMPAAPTQGKEDPATQIQPTEERPIVGEKAPTLQDASGSHGEKVLWERLKNHPSARPRPLRRPARAGSHLAAAGEAEQAARQYLVAMREAAAHGAAEQALMIGRKALALLARLPKTGTLKAEILAEIGRIQWEQAGPSGFTLSDASQTITQAFAALGEEGLPRQKAMLYAIRAGISYEIGDQSNLNQALDDLSMAMRLLQEAGEAQAAARLLNEQAAVWVRLGDPVRAAHLMRETLKMYETARHQDPQAAAEWAETQHLLSRLPLHTQARTGQEEAALRRALAHGQEAEAVWKRLGAQRELARVWDTLGQLYLRLHSPEQARDVITRAVTVQQRARDIVGLAISMAGLAEVEAAAGHGQEALALLMESVRLNSEKGSVVGLSYNQAILNRLSVDPKLMPYKEALAQQIQKAQAEIHV